MNSEPIPLNLTRLPTPGPVPLNLTRLGIPGPVTLNLTGLPIPGPIPLNLTKVPVPKTLPATRYHVSYFLLAMQWPGAYDRQCPHNGLPAFFIHGLWPHVALPHGHHIDGPLTLPPGGQLIQKMNSIWPSIIRPCNNRAFWEHEWQYHGAFSNLDSQFDYFSKTVALAERVNLLTVLSENDIHPGGVSYPASRLRSVLGRHVHGFAKITCGRHVNDLSQIYICVDRTASHFIRCPQRLNSQCGPRVLFLPFDSR